MKKLGGGSAGLNMRVENVRDRNKMSLNCFQATLSSRLHRTISGKRRLSVTDLQFQSQIHEPVIVSRESVLVKELEQV